VVDWVERDWEGKIRILPDRDDTILPNQIYPRQDMGSREDTEVEDLMVEVEVDMAKVLHPDMGIIEVVHPWVEEEDTEMEMVVVVDMVAVEVTEEAVVDMVVVYAVDMMIVARHLDITMIVVHLQGEVEDMAAAAVVVIAVAVDLLQAMEEEEDIMMDHVMVVVAAAAAVEGKEVDMVVIGVIAEEV
jgi:hypothetical protein